MHGNGNGLSLGFGDVAVQSTALPTAPKINWVDSVSNVINKIVTPGVNAYTQIKTAGQTPQPGSTTPTYTPTSTYTPAPAAPAPQDNTKKYLLIGGALVLAAGGIYLVTRKKK